MWGYVLYWNFALRDPIEVWLVALESYGLVLYGFDEKKTSKMIWNYFSNEIIWINELFELMIYKFSDTRYDNLWAPSTFFPLEK